LLDGGDTTQNNRIYTNAKGCRHPFANENEVASLAPSAKLGRIYFRGAGKDWHLAQEASHYAQVKTARS
jgi:hypothetical protein